MAAPERQDSQVISTSVRSVRQVISCELCESPKVKISVSQGASQGRSFLARAFDLARPGVAPPLQPSHPCLVKFGSGTFELYWAHKLCILANGQRRRLIWSTVLLLPTTPTDYQLDFRSDTRYATLCCAGQRLNRHIWMILWPEIKLYVLPSLIY